MNTELLIHRLTALCAPMAAVLVLAVTGTALQASPQVPMSPQLRANAIVATCEHRGGAMIGLIGSAPTCQGAHELLDDYMRRTGYNPALEPTTTSQKALDTCEARGGGIVNHIGIPGRTECMGAKEFVTQYDARLSGMQQTPPPPAPSGERVHTVEAGMPQGGGQPLTGAGVSQGAPDTPPPPNPGVNAGMLALGVGAAVAGAVAIGSALGSTDYSDGGSGGGTCYLRSCFQSSLSGCSCQEFDSAELCQFSETTPGGQCGDTNGFTTALCPDGYSCVNNTCRTDC